MKQLEDLETHSIYTVAKQKAVLVNITFSNGTTDLIYMSQQQLNLFSDQLAMAAEALNEWKVTD